MNRDNYLAAVKSNLETNIFYHSLALEACMGGIYDYLSSQNQLGAGEPPRDDWSLAGLVHDIDYAGSTKADHPRQTRSVLKNFDLEISDTVDHIIKAHAPELTGVDPKNQADWAIFCADSLTGLIVAVTLVYPSKKLADVKTSSVLKRFLKEPRFAAGTRRQDVKMCEEKLSIPLEKFIEVCLDSMRKISSDINL